MNLPEIGNRLKIARIEQNLSQEKLAEMICVTPHYIYEIERGLKSVSLETLVNLSETLGISTDYILFGSSAAKNNDVISLLSEISGERRKNVENVIRHIIPYIK